MSPKKKQDKTTEPITLANLPVRHHFVISLAGMIYMTKPDESGKVIAARAVDLADELLKALK